MSTSLRSWVFTPSGTKKGGVQFIAKLAQNQNQNSVFLPNPKMATLRSRVRDFAAPRHCTWIPPPRPKIWLSSLFSSSADCSSPSPKALTVLKKNCKLPQVVASHKFLVADWTCEVFFSRVSASVPCQLIRTGESLSTIVPTARERSLSWKQAQNSAVSKRKKRCFS